MHLLLTRYVLGAVVHDLVSVTCQCEAGKGLQGYRGASGLLGAAPATAGLDSECSRSLHQAASPLQGEPWWISPEDGLCGRLLHPHVSLFRCPRRLRRWAREPWRCGF